jgi:hypothetical protein
MLLYDLQQELPFPLTIVFAYNGRSADSYKYMIQPVAILDASLASANNRLAKIE